ncbi:MAG TPA: AmmeMemoRadiSam system protein A [Acidobacteriota bacterium]|jgi:hypothetical protein|nr:AmmeMemoRadiSam system protein A [Acidobacteriota bacterium]
MFELGPGEQSELLALARRTLEYFFQSHTLLNYQPQHPSLHSLAGSFVSLHRHVELRGCIGHLEADRAVYINVMESALAAGFQDPRFPPLEHGELSQVSIEISVLSAFTVVNDMEEIRTGTHGLMISMGPCRGLLLPQVAIRFGWDRIRFLEEACFKAGLPRDSWLRGAMIETFSALVFGEEIT